MAAQLKDKNLESYRSMVAVVGRERSTSSLSKMSIFPTSFMEFGPVLSPLAGQDVEPLDVYRSRCVVVLYRQRYIELSKTMDMAIGSALDHPKYRQPGEPRARGRIFQVDAAVRHKQQLLVFPEVKDNRLAYM